MISHLSALRIGINTTAPKCHPGGSMKMWMAIVIASLVLFAGCASQQNAPHVPAPQANNSAAQGGSLPSAPPVQNTAGNTSPNPPPPIPQLPLENATNASLNASTANASQGNPDEHILGFAGGWGSYGSGSGQFTYPRGIAFDSEGNVYVADSGNDRVQIFDSSGKYIAQFGSIGSGNGQFVYPNGIAVGSAGNVYVADSGNSRIQIFDSSGKYMAQFGSIGSGNGQFYNQNGIAAGSEGRVYVADSGNFRIQIFDSSGTRR